jgi:hypothetical protein
VTDGQPLRANGWDAEQERIAAEVRKLAAVDSLDQAHALAEALEELTERLRAAGLGTEEANAALLAWVSAFLFARFGGVVGLRAGAAAGRAVGRSLAKLRPR